MPRRATAAAGPSPRRAPARSACRRPRSDRPTTAPCARAAWARSTWCTMRATVESRRHTTHFEREQRLAIHGTGVDDVAGHLAHGLGLTGHRRLVHRALPGRDDAVERHAATGAHRNDLADGDLRDGHRPRGSALQEIRRGRRHVEHVRDGSSGSRQAASLERLGDAEEHQHGRRLEPLVDGERAGHGHGHQDVDVETPAAGGLPGAPQGARCGQRHGEQQRGAHPQITHAGRARGLRPRRMRRRRPRAPTACRSRRVARRRAR